MFECNCTLSLSQLHLSNLNNEQRPTSQSCNLYYLWRFLWVFNRLPVTNINKLLLQVTTHKTKTKSETISPQETDAGVESELDSRSDSVAFFQRLTHFCEMKLHSLLYSFMSHFKTSQAECFVWPNVNKWNLDTY